MEPLDATLEHLGQALRDRADPITSEPLPARLQSLLNELDARHERRDMAASRRPDKR